MGKQEAWAGTRMTKSVPLVRASCFWNCRALRCSRQSLQETRTGDRETADRVLTGDKKSLTCGLEGE